MATSKTNQQKSSQQILSFTTNPKLKNFTKVFVVITWSMTHLLSMSSLSTPSSACIIFQLLNKKSLLNYHHLGISLLLQQIMHRWIGPLPLQGFHPPQIKITIASCHHHLHHDDSLDREGEESWRYEGVGKAQIAQQVKSQMMVMMMTMKVDGG